MDWIGGTTVPPTIQSSLNIRLTKKLFHLTLMMTSAQVVETSVTVTDNSPFEDYPHPDDHTTQSKVLLGCVHTWCPSTVPEYDS